MSKEMAVIVLGLWLIVEPYLGVPGTWHTVFLVVTGLGVAAVGFLLRGEALSRGLKGSKRHPFVENMPPRQESAPAPEVTDQPTALRHEHREGITSLN